MLIAIWAHILLGLKIVFWIITGTLIIVALHLADYFGHWICVKSFGQRHFEWCDRKLKCPCIGLKK